MPRTRPLFPPSLARVPKQKGLSGHHSALLGHFFKSGVPAPQPPGCCWPELIPPRAGKQLSVSRSCTCLHCLVTRSEVWRPSPCAQGGATFKDYTGSSVPCGLSKSPAASKFLPLPSLASLAPKLSPKASFPSLCLDPDIMLHIRFPNLSILKLKACTL